MMIKTAGYAAESVGAKLKPFAFERREPGDQDLLVDILYCGVCHSDLHMVDNDWGYSLFPMVPGHEIIGRVKTVGSAVKRFAVGDTVGIGTIVDSCRRCGSCTNNLEQYCVEGATQTYSTPERKSPGVTYGGYSNTYVVDEHFAFKIPGSLDPARTAPLLCAGITTYSPLRRWNVGPGQKVGIVGLGGLGHVAVKFAKAMGADVALFTTSPRKVADAKQLGAKDVILSTDPAAMQAHMGSFDFILDTVSAPHDLGAYLALLKVHCTMCAVGLPAQPIPLHLGSLAFGGKSLAGSGAGGMAQTQEMLDFAGRHGIAADIETVKLQDINAAFERLRRNDVKYRFVIAMQ